MSRRNLKSSVPDEISDEENVETNSDYIPSPSSAQYSNPNDEQTPKKVFNIKKKSVDARQKISMQNNCRLKKSPLLKDIPKHR